MAGKLTQELRQTQNLMMTPQLQQAIKLLTLTHLEMTKMIAEEMVENPLLEEESGDARADKQKENDDFQLRNLEMENKEVSSESFSSAEVMKGVRDDFDWNSYIDAYNNNSSSPPPPSMSKIDSDEMPNYENLVSKEQTLAEYLEWQLRMANLTEEEWKLAQFIIGNINDDGRLEISQEEILSSSSLMHEDALEILKMIQGLDPVGCGCTSLEECLMVQAQNLRPRLPLVEILIRDHLPELEKKDHQRIARKLDISKEKIKDAEMIILSFSPRPGRLVSPNDAQYVVPDIYVHDMGGKFTVSLNDEGVPKLKISQLYQSVLKSSESSSEKVRDKEKGESAETEYVQDKLRAAMWLIKSIQNRQRTILKVSEAIVKYQPEFFKKGPRYLRPMILKDIANEIGMHESTVSRVTVNKYMHTPIGTFELKYFFNAGIGGKNGGIDIASEALRIKIKILIETENPSRPFSDQKVVQLLSKEDIVVARRTVAKYREMMSILPSSRRKRSK